MPGATAMAIPAEGRSAGKADAASAKAAEAEHQIAIVRALVILFNSFVWALFLSPLGIPRLAWTTIVVANLYAFYVIVARPYRRFPAMTTATFTAFTDGLLITIWLTATGGFESPFYLLWYLSLIAVAFRYDATATLVASVLYAAAYAGMAWVLGQAEEALVEVGIRVGYILLCGMLGALLAQASSQAIAARVRLEGDLDRSKRFRILAEATSEGIMVHSGGRILQVNGALARMLERPAEQVVGHNLTEFVHDDDLPLAHARIQSPSDAPIEVRLVRADGSAVPVVARGASIPSDGQDLRVVAVRDIRAELEAEAERTLARERDAELERLRELDRMRTTFINTAAHELNTPLTPIRLQLHMLRQKERDAKEERVLQMLDRNLQRLARLVHDMLDVSRLQERRLQLRMETMDLSDTLDHAVETFRYQADDQGIPLQADIAPGMTIHGDRERIEQVMANLLSNALRFSQKGDTIHVAAQAHDDEVEIVVRDEGLGMSPDQQGRLFQPFSQQHAEHTAGGLGLGLFISQGLVRAHGGSIDIESEGPGKGTKVRVLLPVRPPADAEPL